MAHSFTIKKCSKFGSCTKNLGVRSPVYYFWLWLQLAECPWAISLTSLFACTSCTIKDACEYFTWDSWESLFTEMFLFASPWDQGTWISAKRKAPSQEIKIKQRKLEIKLGDELQSLLCFLIWISLLPQTSVDHHLKTRRLYFPVI